MTIDKTLALALTDLESTAPNADTAFADLTARLDGIDRRRSGRTAVRGVVVAGVAAAVAVGVTSLPSEHAATTGSRATARPTGSPAPRTSGAGLPSPALRQVAYSRHLATTTGSDGIRRPVITVDAGWLPHGAVLDSVGAGRDTGDDGEKRWVVPYAGGYGGYDLQIAVLDGRRLPEHCFLCTSSQNLTVHGHPARRFEGDSSGAVDLVDTYVDLGNGTVADVHTFYETRKLSTTDATAVTDHVARTLTFDHHETVPVTALLTAAPPGATIVSAYAGFGDYASTYYQLTSVDGGAEIGIGNFAEKYPVTTGRPGRDVQGRPSMIIHDRNGRTGLYIKGLYGLFTTLYTGAGAERLDDLYLIADGIRSTR